jgi:hypothetical protein
VDLWPSNLFNMRITSSATSQTITCSAGRYTFLQLLLSSSSFLLIKLPDQTWKEIVDLLEDDKGEKENEEDIPRLGKRLKMQLCTLFPDYKPSFYVHVFADHAAAYLKELAIISQKVGFKVTLKMFAQDAVEAAHRYLVLSEEIRSRKIINLGDMKIEKPTAFNTTATSGHQKMGCGCPSPSRS